MCPDEINIRWQLPASASFLTTDHSRHLPHLSFIFLILFPPPQVFLSSGPHRPLSSWHYKLTFATTEQLERSLPLPPCTQMHTHANTQRRMDLLLQMQKECQQEHERGHARIQNDSLVPLSAEGLTKEFPLLFPQPSILCLSDPSSPSSCTLARGLTLESGSQSGSKCD